MTAPGWVVTERDVVRLLALNPRRTEQLRRLGLLHPAGRSDQYAFRDLVTLRVARTLLDQGITVRQIRRALDSLRRVGTLEAPLAELRVTVRDGEIFIERDARLLEPSGQIVMEFSEEGLAEDARASALRGLVRPLLRPGGGEADRWFELASELDGDPAQWAQAVDAYQRVTTLAPDHGAAWNNLGLLQHRMGRFEDARRHYEVALVADPTLAEAAYNLGSLRDDLGDAPQATLWYRRALEIRPDYADAHFNLASALERAGDSAAARRHWARYLELDPDSRWAEIARAWVNGEGS